MSNFVIDVISVDFNLDFPIFPSKTVRSETIEALCVSVRHVHTYIHTHMSYITYTFIRRVPVLFITTRLHSQVPGWLVTTKMSLILTFQFILAIRVHDQ